MFLAMWQIDCVNTANQQLTISATARAMAVFTTTSKRTVAGVGIDKGYMTTQWKANQFCQGLWSAKLSNGKTAYATWVRPDQEYSVRVGSEYVGRFSTLPCDIESFFKNLLAWRNAQGTPDAIYAVNPFETIAV